MTWLIQICDVKHSYAWRASYTSVGCLIQMCDKTPPDVWHVALICLTCLIQMCGMTHRDVCRYSFRCVTCRTNMYDMPHSDMCHDSYRCVTLLIQMCDMLVEQRSSTRTHTHTVKQSRKVMRSSPRNACPRVKFGATIFEPREFVMSLSPATMRTCKNGYIYTSVNQYMCICVHVYVIIACQNVYW